MRHALLIIGFLGWLTAVPGMQTSVSGSVDETEILKHIQARATAFNRHDASAVAALFVVDADRVTSRGVFTGRLEVERSYAEGFASVNKNAALSEGINHVRFVAADVAIRDGEVTITGTTTGTVKNHVTDVYVKRNDRWTLIVSRTIPLQ